MFESLGSVGVLIVVGILALAVVSAMVTFVRRYVKVPPNKAIAIYGKGKTGIVKSGARFVWPFFQNYVTLDLEEFQVEFKTEAAPNKDGVKVTLDALANLKINADDDEAIKRAAERVSSRNRNELREFIQKMLDGMLRELAGTLSIEELLNERASVSQKFLEQIEPELDKLGLTCDNFTINDVTDEEGYIDALGKKRTAEVVRDASIGQAVAQRESMEKVAEAEQKGTEARLAADEEIASYERNLAVKKAGLKKETDTATAEAELAHALKTAEITKELTIREAAVEAADQQARIEVAEQQALRVEKELVATKIRPAEAQREAAIVTADGEAQASVRTAEGEAKATEARAAAEKVKLAAEGEGLAAAEAAQRQQIGMAEGAAIRAKGEAEGAAIRAKLLAEAEGFAQKNKALADLSDGARLLLVLQELPRVIEEAGEAGERVASAAMRPVGEAISGIDSIRVVDFGGNRGDGNAASGLASMGPKLVAEVFTKLEAAGFGFEKILKFAGIEVPDLLGANGNGAHLNGNGAVETPASVPAEVASEEPEVVGASAGGPSEED